MSARRLATSSPKRRHTILIPLETLIYGQNLFCVFHLFLFILFLMLNEWQVDGAATINTPPSALNLNAKRELADLKDTNAKTEANASADNSVIMAFTSVMKELVVPIITQARGNALADTVQTRQSPPRPSGNSPSKKNLTRNAPSSPTFLSDISFPMLSDWFQSLNEHLI